MKIEVWADIVCPWCYIGAVRLRKAVAAYDDPAAVQWTTRSFELDPFADDVPAPIAQHLAQKYSVSAEEAAQMDARLQALADAEGVPYTSDRKVANSHNLHRVVHLAREFEAGEQLFERLQHLYFGEGADVFSTDLLTREAAELGVPQDRVVDLLASDEYKEAVQSDQNEARQLGVTGVPFTVLARKLAIPGAVSSEQFHDALKKIS